MAITLLSKAQRAVRRLLFSPRVRTSPEIALVRLGSTYGGWTFRDEPDLYGCVVISGGLGEDASFDVEFAAKYGATVCVVDPTPRAVEHFHALMGRIGSPAIVGYGPTGSQPPEAYDLTNTDKSQLVLVPKALTDRDGWVRLYAPPNPEHVSYSMIDFQNSYERKGAWIEVSAIDVASVVRSMTPPGITLLKLDIEGAETLVLPRLLASNVPLPKQILVEFDELNVPSRRSKRSFKRVHEALLKSGYVPVYWDRKSCVSYFLDNGTKNANSRD